MVSDPHLYAHHSVVTDPGAGRYLLADLPADPAALIDIAAALVIHFTTDRELLRSVDTDARRAEVDSRFASTMLATIVALDQRPLGAARPPEARLLATCRDAAVLLCTLFRQVGIPARVRYGFANYLYQPNQILHDHVLAEYWDGSRWCLADSRLRSFAEKYGLTHLPAANLPRHLVRTGAEAWRRIRRDGEKAGLYAGLKRDDNFGLWTVRNVFLYDLASLAGVEPLMWDAWGVMLLGAAGQANFVPEQLAFLDAMAELDPLQPAECAELVSRFVEAHSLFPEDEIVAFSPVNGMHRVSLAAHRRALEGARVPQ